MEINKQSHGNGKAVPVNPLNVFFFPQCVAHPNPLNPREIVITALPGTGIPSRDYFAAKAMQAFLELDGENDYSLSTIAADAYRMADAMLTARLSETKVKEV